MRIARVQLPDGRVAKFEVADGITPEQVEAFVSQTLQQQGQRQQADHASEMQRHANRGAFAVDQHKQAAAAAGQAYRLPGQRGSEAGVVEQFLGGGKRAWDRAALGLKGVFTDLSPEDRAMLERGKQFVAHTGAASTVGEIAGDIALSGGPAARASTLIAQGASRLPRALAALARGGGAVGTGAGIGAITNPEDRQQGAAFGGLGAGFGAGAQRLIGGALRPLVSQEAAALAREGVQPTPGQWVGEGWQGAGLRGLEERLSKLPIVGGSIRDARTRAVGELNDAVNKSAGIAGRGEDAVLEGREFASGLFDEALKRGPRDIRIEQGQLMRKALELADDPALAMSEATQKRFLDYVEKYLLRRDEIITPEVAKRIESDIGKAAHRASTGNNTAEERVFGEALQQMHGTWRKSLEAALPAESRAILQQANQLWRAQQPILEATGRASSKDAGGMYTPKVLRQAIANQDKTRFDLNTRRIAAGGLDAANTPYERVVSLADAGAKALGNHVPDSGTAGNLAAGALLMRPDALAKAWASSTLLSLPYSRIGSKLITQGIAPETVDRVFALAQQRGIAPEAIEAQLPNLLRAVGQGSQTEENTPPSAAILRALATR